MDLRHEAAKRIADLFGDGGHGVLAEGQLGDSWALALAEVPEKRFLLPAKSLHPVGERLLSRVRDYWGASAQLRKAVAATRGLVRVRTVRLGAGHPDTLIELGALGALADRAGRNEDAGRMLSQSFQGLRETLGGRDMRVAIVAGNLALHFMRNGEPEQAEQLLILAHRIRRDVAPKTTGVVAAQLADLYLRSDRAEQAVPLLVEAHALTRDRFGPLHARTVPKARVLAAVLTQLTRYGQAEPVLRDLHQHAQANGTDEQKAEASFDLGMALRRLERYEEAYRLLEQAVSSTKRAGNPHPALPERLTAWARITLERRRPEEAEGLLKEALEAEVRLHGEGSVEVAVRYAELGKFIADRGRFAEAMGWLDPAASLLKGKLGPEHPITVLAAENLVELLVMQAREVFARGGRAEAKELLGHAEQWGKLLDKKHPLNRQLIDAQRQR